MFRHIPIADLKKGLYVIDQHKGQSLNPPLYSVEGYILSDEEPEALARAGFQNAWIDDERTVIPPDNTLSEKDLIDLTDTDHPLHASVPYLEEYERASRLYAKSLEVAKEITARIETHTDIALDETRELFTDMLSSLTRNYNALCSLAKLKNKDDYTFTHCINVAVFAVTLGKQLGVKNEFLIELGMAGFFHDIGKIFVPSEILNCPGRLNAIQFNKIKEHPDLGRRYLNHYPNLPPLVCQGTRDHHERYTGKGYPAGKRGEEISLAGRLLAVVDVYDAISSKRCYKEAITPAETLAIMYQSREDDFSPGFVEAFISVLGIYPAGSLVRLSNKYYAVVVEQNESAPLRPKVVLLIDAFGARLDHPKLVDLMIHVNLSIHGPVLQIPVDIDVEDAIKYAH